MKYFFLFIINLICLNISVFATTQQFNNSLLKLEKDLGKIGVYAIDTNNNQTLGYRADERFPVQSTFKLIAVSALLKKADENKDILNEIFNYTKDDLIFWHPITGKYLNKGSMTLELLSEAAMSYSDNVASNLIVRKIGGPSAVTEFAHSIGNKTFNLMHYEPELNSNPKIIDDTSTPKDMALSVKQLMLGNILTEAQKQRLITWMRNNTTGHKKIRAGLGAGWSAAEKTGGGDGISNDIGIVWSPYCKPIVIAIYTVQNKKNAKIRPDILAAVTSIILKQFSKYNECFAATAI